MGRRKLSRLIETFVGTANTLPTRVEIPAQILEPGRLQWSRELLAEGRLIGRNRIHLVARDEEMEPPLGEARSSSAWRSRNARKSTGRFLVTRSRKV